MGQDKAKKPQQPSKAQEPKKQDAKAPKATPKKK